MIKDVVFAVLVIWAMVWMVASDIDYRECMDRGYQYDYTTPFFNGYCQIGDDPIPLMEIIQ